MKLRTLVIDDEPLARKGMEEYIQELTFLHHVASFENAGLASVFLASNHVDLLLLDINMPKLSGIDFLKSLKEPPMVIFTTAFPDYALESYSLDVIDYLLKPIPFERFLKATQKAFDFHTRKQRSESTVDYFFIKCDHKFERVNYHEILFIEAMQNYCIVHTQAKKQITYITLAGMLEKLPANRFIKVHKSFIIALDKVTALEGSDVMVENSRIPISRNLKEEVIQKIMGNRLLKR